MKPEIIYEDEWILVVNKPAGLVVNKSLTINEETLQDQLSYYLQLGNDLGIGDRAGIIHRLDRETSGILLVAKTQEAFDALQAQFKNRTIIKKYVALVHGLIKDKYKKVEVKLGRIGKFGKFGVVQVGKESRTDFTVSKFYQIDPDRFNTFLGKLNLTKSRINYLKHHATDYTLLSIQPATGRTHQIRVHLKSIGYPLVSDLIYTPRKLLNFDLNWCPRLFLHAESLEFVHPSTKRRQKFGCDLPKELKSAILNLTII